MLVAFWNSLFEHLLQLQSSPNLSGLPGAPRFGSGGQRRCPHGSSCPQAAPRTPLVPQKRWQQQVCRMGRASGGGSSTKSRGIHVCTSLERSYLRPKHWSLRSLPTYGSLWFYDFHVVRGRKQSAPPFTSVQGLVSRQQLHPSFRDGNLCPMVWGWCPWVDRNPLLPHWGWRLWWQMPKGLFPKISLPGKIYPSSIAIFSPQCWSGWRRATPQRAAWYPTMRGSWRWRKQGSTTSTHKSASAPRRRLRRHSPSIFICTSPWKRTGSWWRDLTRTAPPRLSVSSSPSGRAVSSSCGRATWSLSMWRTQQQWTSTLATPTLACSSCREEGPSPSLLSQGAFPVSRIYVPLPVCCSCFLFCIFCYLLMRAKGPWEQERKKVWSCRCLHFSFFLSLVGLRVWSTMPCSVGPIMPHYLANNTNALSVLIL